MLHSYEAIYDHGIMKWLGEKPADIEARVIVTVLQQQSTLKVLPQVSPRIAGKGKILGDLVSPAAAAEDWFCLK